ncbi:hypothetical protein ACFL2E_11020 [Thermodesulfobacteriota bacterium]
MSKARWILFVVVMLIATGYCDVWAGGRLRMPQNHPWVDSILLNAWCRDDHINVAVCNVAAEDRTLKIAVGSAGKEQQFYGSTTLELPRRTLKMVSFPLMCRKTPQGDMKTADTVFAIAEIDTFRGMVKHKPIQQIMVGDRFPELTNFLVNRKERVVFRYTVTDEANLTVVFIPKSIVANRFGLSGRLVSGTSHKPVSKSDIERLNLPATYERDLLKQLNENYCFLFSSVSLGTATVSYDFEGTEACSLVNIPSYTYIFDGDGSVTAGGGQGLVVMVYNPDDIDIQPSFSLTWETGKQKAGKHPFIDK